MEGRDHTGVLVVLNASGDPVRTDEWNSWYVEDHIPEVLATEVFETAARFSLAEGFELPAAATHMAVYETRRPDVPGTIGDLGRAFAERPMTPGPPSTRVQLATYTKISEYGEGAGRRANGVVVVFSDCSDPAQEDAFNAWYEHHGRHVIDERPQYAVCRYVADAPKPWEPKYLAIYETEETDPGRVQREGWEWYFSLPPEDIPPMRLWCEAALERQA